MKVITAAAACLHCDTSVTVSAGNMDPNDRAAPEESCPLVIVRWIIEPGADPSVLSVEQEDYLSMKGLTSNYPGGMRLQKRDGQDISMRMVP
ncbi:hypothetical protein CEXT_24651 [Caerostris extrusa]|uniref:Uncharacterized protein n=1 Tax=Caerostris extrusa TaxID=172846 RepID=A0AAV4V9L0_CAEEX|nr:hypothetical protein CEXT_24651 [Caerostris extrusa]